MSDLILEQIQADIYGALKATPGLATAEIMSANDGDIEAEVTRKLLPLTGALRGLALVVLLPELTESESNLPGPVMDGMIEIQVIEAVLVNRGDGGTGIRASTAALRALGALHHLRVGNYTLFAKRNPLDPLAGKKGIITYLVRMYFENVGADPVEKVFPVTIAEDEAEITLTTSTSGASIYYTTDGSYPGESNAEADLYTVPFTLSESATVRAAAFKSPLNPSDIAELAVTVP
jgi:Chitobiase/beta-hexosaminidase C-terminal domain